MHSQAVAGRQSTRIAALSVALLRTCAVSQNYAFRSAWLGSAHGERRIQGRKNGRGKLLSYTATENAEAIRSYKKEINQSVGSFLRNTRFVPLIVDGERKELVNLYYTVNIYNRN